MKKSIAAMSLAACTSVFCAPTLDKDGVPIVDIHGVIVKSTDAKAIATANKLGTPVPSKRMIVVGDKQIPLLEFLLTYCQARVQNDTCARGGKIERIDSSGGPREKLPAGL